MNNQANNQNQQITSLSQTVTELNTNLNSLKPNNSETVQIITYALLATAIVGIFVYQYINNYEHANK